MVAQQSPDDVPVRRAFDELAQNWEEGELKKLTPKILKAIGSAVAAMIAAGILLRQGWQILSQRGRSSRFGRWVEDDVGVRRSTCYELMNLADHFADCPVADRIGVTGLKLLAAPSVPQAARDIVISKTEKGEQLKVAEIKAVIAKAKRKNGSAEPSTPRLVSVHVNELGTLVLHTKQAIDRSRLESLLRELAHELLKGTTDESK